MSVIKKFKHNGFKIKIYADESPVNPRIDYDHTGTITCFHGRYNIGDKHNFDDIDDFFVSLMSDNYIFQERVKLRNAFVSWDDFEELLTRHGDPVARDKAQQLIEEEFFMLPVFLYDHSGLALNTTGFSCRWDSGQIGFAYVSKKKVRKEWSVKRISPKIRETVLNGLRAEVDELSQYANGEVYGYVVKKDGEEIDSCWGIYGLEQVEQMAKEATN